MHFMQSTMYPRELNSDGTKKKYCRGYGLYGPQFMTEYNGVAAPKQSCCCDTEECLKVGYSHCGMMMFPPDDDHRKVIIVLLHGIMIQIICIKMKMVNG